MQLTPWTRIPADQRAVIREFATRLRSNGAGWRALAKAVESEYAIKVSYITLRKWFTEPDAPDHKPMSAPDGRGLVERVQQAKENDKRSRRPPPERVVVMPQPDEVQSGQPHSPAGKSSPLERLREVAEIAHSSLISLKSLADESDGVREASALYRLTTDAVTSAAKVWRDLHSIEGGSAAIGDQQAGLLANLASGLAPSGEYRLWPHQRTILDAASKYVFVTGGVGTGKTDVCVLKLLLHCARNPGQRIVVAAQTYKQVRFVFVESWQRLVPPDWYTYNKVDHWIRMDAFDAELQLMYAENPRAAKVALGVNRTGYYLIQPETWRDQAMYDALEQRVRVVAEGQEKSTDSPHHIRLLDSNGGSPDHFLFRRFVDRQSDYYAGDTSTGTEKSMDYYRLVDDGAVTAVHVPTTAQASAYTQQTLDDWQRAMPEGRYRQWVLGEWVASEGRVYDQITVADQSVNVEQIAETWIGMDPGTARDPEDSTKGNLALVVVCRLQDGTWRIVDEAQIAFRGLVQVEQLVRSWIDKYGGSAKFRAVVKDWSGGAGVPIADHLRSQGIHTASPGGAAARRRFFSVRAGIAKLYGPLRTGLLQVDPQCRLILQDFRQYVYGPGDDPDKSAYDPHLLDALRYCWILAAKWLQEENPERS